MTTLLYHADAMKSGGGTRPSEQPPIEALSGATLLAAHRTAQELLLQKRTASDQAIAIWRAALAERWICEIAALRLYKRITYQMISYYDCADAPELLVVTGSHQEALMTPADLLADLRRIAAAITMSESSSPFAAWFAELHEVCTALEQAINATIASENQRRLAVLERRAAEDAYVHATQQMLREIAR